MCTSPSALRRTRMAGNTRRIIRSSTSSPQFRSRCIQRRGRPRGRNSRQADHPLIDQQRGQPGRPGVAHDGVVIGDQNPDRCFQSYLRRLSLEQPGDLAVGPAQHALLSFVFLDCLGMVVLCYLYEIDTYPRCCSKHDCGNQTPGTRSSKVNAGGVKGNTRHSSPPCASGGGRTRLETHHGQDRPDSNVGPGGDLR
jgi:hypothetical protein